MDNIKESNNKFSLLVLIIILAQCMLLTCVFAFKKEGYHSDELWNYGFANSSDGRHIYADNKGEPKNFYNWTDSKVFLDYLSVDESEKIDYKSAYKNAAYDLNPPFQYMMLHFVSSLFPGTWSKWYCFVINILSFAISQIFIYKLLKLINGEEIYSVLGVLLYGFCIGALEITSFLRIYALGAAFGVAFLYLFTKIYYDSKNNKKVKISDAIKLFVVCFVGAFTIHQFLIIAFIITLMYSLYFLFKKKFRYMFTFGFVCLAAVIVSFLVFPSSKNHMSVSAQSYSLEKGTEAKVVLYQFVDYLSFVFKDVIGIHPELEISALHAVLSMVIGFAAASFLTVCLICKNKKWVQSLKNHSLNYAKRIKDYILKSGYPFLVLLVSFLFDIAVCAKNSSISKMGVYSKRYIFMVYPVCAMIIAQLIGVFVKSLNIKKITKKRFCVGITLAFAGLTFVLSDAVFLFNLERKGIRIKDIEKNADCIIVVEEPWLLTAITADLCNTNSFYAVDREFYIQDNYERANNDNPLYLIIDCESEAIYEDEEDKMIAEAFGLMTNKEEILEYYGNLPISSGYEFVGQDYIFDRKTEIYRLK